MLVDYPGVSVDELLLPAAVPTAATAASASAAFSEPPQPSGGPVWRAADNPRIESEAGVLGSSVDWRGHR